MYIRCEYINIVQHKRKVWLSGAGGIVFVKDEASACGSMNNMLCLYIYIYIVRYIWALYASCMLIVPHMYTRKTINLEGFFFRYGNDICARKQYALTFAHRSILFYISPFCE